MADICIANELPGARRCVVQGAHLAHCDGWARRQLEVEEYDGRRTTRRWRTLVLAPDPDGDTERDRVGTACGGCLPRPAESGHLCGFHARQAEAAIDATTDLAVHLWSVNSGPVTADERIGSAFGSRWPLKDSRIRANELAVHLVALVSAVEVDHGIVGPEPHEYLAGYLSPFHGFRHDSRTTTVARLVAEQVEWLAASGSDVWARRLGATATIPLVAAVRAAERAYPTEDRAHRVPVLRCRNCNRMALTWHPPLYYLDDDAIKCDACGAVEDRSLIEHDMRVILDARTRKVAP